MNLKIRGDKPPEKPAEIFLAEDSPDINIMVSFPDGSENIYAFIDEDGCFRGVYQAGDELAKFQSIGFAYENGLPKIIS